MRGKGVGEIEAEIEATSRDVGGGEAEVIRAGAAGW